ncbi:hypothetical protein [Streptomyces noursei]|uniref:hypothetical protein n=1 Tax=Streptomyces noursei TaxID=1971 RepID=UPI000A9A75B8|nr:hypothetical protein [Streptomyces noursei]
MSDTEFYVWRLTYMPDKVYPEFFDRAKFSVKSSGSPSASTAGLYAYKPNSFDSSSLRSDFLYDQRNKVIHMNSLECRVVSNPGKDWGERDCTKEETRSGFARLPRIIPGVGGGGDTMYEISGNDLVALTEPANIPGYGLSWSGATKTAYRMPTGFPGESGEIIGYDVFSPSSQGKDAAWACVIARGGDGKKHLLSAALDSLTPDQSPAVPGLTPVLELPSDAESVTVDPDGTYVWIGGTQALYRLHLKSGGVIENYAIKMAEPRASIRFWSEGKNNVWAVVPDVPGDIHLLAVHGSTQEKHPVINCGDSTSLQRPLGGIVSDIRDSDGRALIYRHRSVDLTATPHVLDVDLKGREAVRSVDLPSKAWPNQGFTWYYCPGWTL